MLKLLELFREKLTEENNVIFTEKALKAYLNLKAFQILNTI